MDFAANNLNTDLNPVLRIESKFWCFMCEEEFSHTSTESGEVFCPKCSSISERIEDDNDPTQFRPYDAQQEGSPQPTHTIGTNSQTASNTNQGVNQPQSQGNSQGSTFWQQIPISGGIAQLPNLQVWSLGGPGLAQPTQSGQNFLGGLLNPITSMMNSFFSGRTLFDDLNNPIIQQFLMNDPNRHGPPPASTEMISKLQESKFSVESCKTKECTICQDDYKEEDPILELPCDHNFHKACVNEWLSRHNSCPVCRKGLKDEPQQQQQQE